MKSLHLITVGKLKDKSYESLEAEYTKRFKDLHFKVHEVKSHEENLDRESEEVLKKVNQIEKNGKARLILLTEKGEKKNSVQFSKWLYKLLESHSQIILVIGGASGHGQSVYDASHGEISLSPLTFPHKMARLILIEQLYRAETIFLGHPYNK
jgi:23S rRNA (pseudouridine1915-N3)-methyltransferase